MKVFADTNFLVSAFATRGLSADVFQVILAEHEIMTGEFVLDELYRTLTSKLKVSAKIAREAEELLRQYYVEPVPDQPSEIQVRDEDDRWVLESALRAGAEILITEDKDLLEISDKVTELKIVTPRMFWELIQN
ncbi:MAG TPA: putative toxin-antitoxin system toxin component, PIN family [Balneolaceae bacterium]|nr:putative toxin-antitoxin system toxin component, PIN family [Balneolaceae bacterium]|tara:strand:+ start:64435 stop:64836 length:402 start_codon:yes stop_codon:yes gene_type:complete